MKKIIIVIGLALSLTTITRAQNAIDKTYDLDISKSTIRWTGSYLFQFSEHTGTVSFKSGQIYTKNNNIIGGAFIVDMTSITNKEHKENPKNGPVEHLKNGDFFDVALYPEASLVLTKITYFNSTNEHRFEGNLTIKGIANPIMIRAFVDARTKTINTKFKIDRTEWGITYNSSYKDSAISDAMEFDISLKFE